MGKISVIKTLALVIGIFLIATSVSSSNIISGDKAVVVNERTSDNQISMSYFFEEPMVDLKSIGNVIYDSVSLKSLTGSGNPGEPKLPSKPARILLPPETKISEISVIPGEKRFLGSGFYIEPVALPYPLSQIDTASLPIPDEAIYTSDDPFPGKLFNEVGKQSFRGYDILILELFPVEYVPLTGDLFYYEDLTVSISLVDDKAGMNSLFRGTLEDRAEVMFRIDNPEVVDMYPQRGEDFITMDVDDYDLLIITTDSLESDFEPLKLVRDSEGVKTEIKTISDIGSSDTDDVRDFIRNEYLSYNVSYVLFGGDYDVAPTQDLWVEAWPGGTAMFMPSDLFFSCLDGTYNYDGDSRYGEPNDGDGGGSLDLLAEVYVGRACVSDSTEVGYFVDKTLAYIGADDSYLNNFLMVGEWLGFGGSGDYGGNSMDVLIDMIPSNEFEYDINTLYDRDWPGFDPLDPGNTGWPKSEIIDRLNNNVHMLNHLGHAYYYSNLKMGLSDVSSLENDKHTFIYSQGCMAGGFDNGDCIAEYFTIKNDHGAFAGIWNARYGWGSSGSVNGPSQRFHRKFIEAIFEEGITEISRANQYSKEENLYNIGGNCMRWCYYELNLFGDPTLAIKSPWLPEHNINVETMVAKDHIKSNELVYVNTTVLNDGRNNETNVVVSLLVNDLVEDTYTIPFFESCTRQDVSFTWIPTAGLYDVAINVSVDGITEEFYSDNEKHETITAGVQNIDTTECFETIQTAIDDVDTIDGHSIAVPSGMYQENVIISKDIYLIGENKDTTVIESVAPTDNVVSIQDSAFANVTGFTLQNGEYGVNIGSSSNTYVTGNNLQDNNLDGVYISSSDTVVISDNGIIGNNWGVTVTDSSNNVIISSNNIENNYEGGIQFEQTNNNFVISNIIIDNNNGIVIDSQSTLNYIHSNHLNNTNNANDAGSNNIWENGYPAGGNWWSDYTGSDDYRGHDQDIPLLDGIGDTPYNIPGGINQDRYPQMYSADIVIINTNNGEEFLSIQEAIDDSDTLDTHSIFVKSNLYLEEIIISKSINLIGEHMESTIIDGMGRRNVIKITAPGVVICGFTLQNCGDSQQQSGVNIRSNNNQIIGNKFKDNRYGMYIRDSSHNDITSNVILQDNIWGMRLENSSNNEIIENNIEKSEMWGILLAGSSSENTINKNNIRECTQTWGAIGIDAGSNNNFLSENTLKNNKHAIYLAQASTNNIITNNAISDNIYGIYAKHSSNNNQIYHNNLMNNTMHSHDECENIWDNGYPSGGNYWDDYIGTDGDEDGIGDIPYFIPGGTNQDNYPLMQPLQHLNIFIRGDTTADENIDMSDALYLLKYLYVPNFPEPHCMDALDANDDGQIQMSDSIFLLRALYVPGAEPIPAPCGDIQSPGCGTDPTEDGLNCLCHPCFDCY